MEAPTPPPNTPPDGFIAYLLWVLIIISTALIGGTARLFHDKYNEDEEREDKGVGPSKITRRDWAYYLSMSLLAGIIVGFFVMYQYGFSLLLIVFSGAAGFGSIQILGLVVKLTTDFIKRVFPK